MNEIEFSELAQLVDGLDFEEGEVEGEWAEVRSPNPSIGDSSNSQVELFELFALFKQSSLETNRESPTIDVQAVLKEIRSLKAALPNGRSCGCSDDSVPLNLSLGLF